LKRREHKGRKDSASKKGPLRSLRPLRFNHFRKKLSLAVKPFGALGQDDLRDAGTDPIEASQVDSSEVAEAWFEPLARHDFEWLFSFARFGCGSTA
jgi:hypothetical protein